jgi:hypothetical protein
MLAPSPNRAAELGPQKFSWWKDWRGECVAIVASGPSAKIAGVELLRDRIHVIAVNESYKLCPWTEVLYSCDEGWWKLRDGVKEFSGLKIAHSASACTRYSDVRRVYVEAKSDDLKLDEPGQLGAAGNSGFQATNLAVQFGVDGILLVGFDMHLNKGAHWHGRHPSPLSNPAQSNVDRWLRGFERAENRFQSLGIQVINCSLDSALKSYPRMTIADALARWGL